MVREEPVRNARLFIMVLLSVSSDSSFTWPLAPREGEATVRSAGMFMVSVSHYNLHAKRLTEEK